MENRELRAALTQFNGLWKEMDDVYHSLARCYGLSDCAMWILYVLRESEDADTQSKIRETLSLSKQTVHSALKTLEQAGLLRLEPFAGNHKNKRVLLTEAGQAAAEQTVDRILCIEQEAFGCFSAQERAMYLRLLEQYVRRLQQGAEKILNPEQTEGALV